jgi:hypothetical protein
MERVPEKSLGKFIAVEKKKVSAERSDYNVTFGVPWNSHQRGANRSPAGFVEENSPGARVFHKVFHRNC